MPVEQRREHRFEPDQTVRARVLGMPPGPDMPVCILDISGSGMRLLSTLPVPCGVHIEIEVSNSVARGIVCRCDQDKDLYELGIQVLETAPEDISPLGSLLNGVTRS